MDDSAVASVLESLAQVDADAWFAYGRALDAIDEPKIRRRLRVFRSDHRRHVEELGREIRRLGGTPPDLARDAMGVAIEGYTALRGATGTAGALHAMKTNERLTRARYESALEQDLPPRIAALLRKNRDDERRHFNYIARVLQSRGGLAPARLIGASGLLAAIAALGGIGAWYAARRGWKVTRAVSSWSSGSGGGVAARGAGLEEHDLPAEGITDLADVAQIQMPGLPQNLALKRRDPLEAARRRAFDEMVRTRRRES